MKRILLGLLIITCIAFSLHAQDTATQQQLDKLSGQIQDLLAAQGKHDQVLAELRRDISELRDKVNTPQVNDSASREDLKALAEKVQEIDRKRQEDRDLILKEIEKLGRVAATPVRRATPKPTEDTSPAPTTPQKGYDYTIAPGDTLSAIAKAYHDQGVKVTATQILKANPGLDATKLYVGKKIFIPDPNAK
jgi:LysM repeat protein